MALHPDSREHFLSVIQQTAPRITETEIVALRDAMASEWEELQSRE